MQQLSFLRTKPSPHPKKSFHHHSKQDWSFAGKTPKETSYITHGYYTYPAKFIPQLAAKLIQKHSEENDLILDPFVGSGTTVIEALVNRRIGIGVDINPIATLAAKVKSTPIHLKRLHNQYTFLMERLSKIFMKNSKKALCHATETLYMPERIHYWFKPRVRDQLAIILSQTRQTRDPDVKDFFLVAFAQILKSCSIWKQRSIKPMRDMHKKDSEPLRKLDAQLKKMIKQHEAFLHVLPDKVRQEIDTYRTITNTDAHNIPCEDKTINTIVTSPPYVTSYEYADLHQLSALWLGYLDELSPFRKKFIGSAYSETNTANLKSPIAQSIVSKLKNKKQQEVRNYFSHMMESFLEMKRVLKKGGKAAIVIGNNQFQGVDILNVQVFQEQLESIGMTTYDMIERNIPSKMLPSTRDPKTGRFAKVNNDHKTLAYPKETILIMQKN